MLVSYAFLEVNDGSDFAAVRISWPREEHVALWEYGAEPWIEDMNMGLGSWNKIARMKILILSFL